MIYMDSETCGLGGMPVIFQYAEDDGPVKIHNLWTTPIAETLELIEWFTQNEMCFFNAAFDWFMICKAYTTFQLFPDLNAYPEDHIDEIAILEERARFTDICLKPRAACDLMLLARKGRYQSLMNRDPIRIRRVPTALAWELARELERRIKFDDIYFAKAKDQFAPRWKIYDIKKPDGTIHPDFKDIKLHFKAGSGLKNLYRHAFGITEKMFTFRDIEVDRKFWPFEYLYAPYALAVAPNYPITKSWRATVKSQGRKRKVDAWPGVISEHILHWSYNADARKYAADDVNYTRRLYKEHFNSPDPGDNDSELACMVAACRWKGYAINAPRIKELRLQAFEKIQKIPTAPGVTKKYIMEAMDETEKVALLGSTKRTVLEEIATWLNDDDAMHPAAVRAQKVLDARKAQKEIELYDKLLRAQRFHASFKVIGALSSRMAGADGLNPQGINHLTYVREAFPLADRTPEVIKYVVGGIEREFDLEIMTLCGGDFKSFEVSLAAKVFDDKRMTKDLLSGVKVHAVMGTKLFPGTTYDEVRASEGKNPDMYDIGKKGFFLKCYFGNAHTFHTKLGRPMEIAEKADNDFNREYPDVKRFQDSVVTRFSCLLQPGGIGSRIDWKDPAEYAESFLGFRRFFTLENQVIRELYHLAQNPPPSFKNVRVAVIRRDRVQTAGGAVASALYGAAFGIMSANIRAAGNHYIQSPGAEITKAVQRNIWNLQPSGIGTWIVQPMNIHDEIMCPTRSGYERKVEQAAQSTVADYRKRVPLLAIDWFTNISSWASKKGEKIDQKLQEAGNNALSVA